MVSLREATAGDLPLLLAWRNNPLVWIGTYTQREPIKWQDHRDWWQSRNKDHHSFMVLLFEDDIIRPVGVLHISLLDYWSPEIGIIIGEVSLWNKGIGTEAFRLGIEWLKCRGYKYTSTTVPQTNHAMVRVLEKLGFHEDGTAREGERRFARRIT